jgi:hypothetical protein
MFCASLSVIAETPFRASHRNGRVQDTSDFFECVLEVRCKNERRPPKRAPIVNLTFAQQQQLVVASERDGLDAVEALRLLEKFLKLQKSRELDRAQILDELSEIS